MAAGVITVTYGADANTKITDGTVILTPVDDGQGNLHWKCTSDGAKVKTVYVPSSCTDN